MLMFVHCNAYNFSCAHVVQVYRIFVFKVSPRKGHVCKDGHEDGHDDGHDADLHDGGAFVSLFKQKKMTEASCLR